MTTMSRIAISRRSLLGVGAAVVGTVAMPAVLRAKTLKWIGASTAPQSDFISQALDVYAERVKDLTKGEILISSHYAGSLGGERENVEGLLQGSIQVATPGAALLAGWYKPAEVFTYPYLFKSVAHKDRAMTAIMDEYGEEVAKKAKLRPIAAIARMPRMLSSNRDVKTPADLKGFKIRVPETPMWKRTFEHFGASPTPMPFPDVFQALKSGVIDGQENPTALTYNSGIFDVNHNLALTEHMMQDNMIVLPEATFQGVGAEQRKALVQAAREMEENIRPKVLADDAVTLAKVKEKKVAINDVDKDAFRASLKGMEAEFPHVRQWAERITAIS